MKPLTWSSSSSRAHTIAMRDMVPLPIHRLAPLITHSSPSRRAVVAMPPATSEPCSGSVSAKQPVYSIAYRPGSHFCFCSSEPRASRVAPTRSLCRAKYTLREMSARASSAIRCPRNNGSSVMPLMWL